MHGFLKKREKEKGKRKKVKVKSKKYLKRKEERKIFGAQIVSYAAN